MRCRSAARKGAFGRKEGTVARLNAAKRGQPGAQDAVGVLLLARTARASRTLARLRRQPRWKHW